MADIDYFIQSMNKQMNVTYGEADRQWLTIGGSYAGALSAWFNAKYDSSAAAWASSGVILAQKNFPEYDQVIYESVSN